MTRDRAAVKKIVQRAIKNNPQVIVALILVLGELVRRPGAPALTSADAEDAVDEVRGGQRHGTARNSAGGEPTRSLRAGLGQRPCGGEGPLRPGCRGGA